MAEGEGFPMVLLIIQFELDEGWTVQPFVANEPELQVSEKSVTEYSGGDQVASREVSFT